MSRVAPLGGTVDTEAVTADDIADQEFAAESERRQVALAKVLSPAFGRPNRRRAQLIARLKRRRKYADPVKGGTGRNKRKNRGGTFKA